MPRAMTYAPVDPGASSPDAIANALRQLNYNLVARVPDMHPELYWVMMQDFEVYPGDRLPWPWSGDRLSGNETMDYQADEPAGVWQMALTNGVTNEQQAVDIDWKNQRMIDTDKGPIIDFRVRVDGIGDLTSVERIAIGLVADHTNPEDTIDNIDHSCWFLFKDGDAKIYIESDDGATDNDDKDSGLVLVDDTWTWFRIDMADLSDVKMYVDGVQQGWALVNMSSSSSQLLQPMVVLQRDDNSQAEVGFQVELDYIRVMARR